MQFYNVKSRSKVEVADRDITKKIYIKTSKTGATQTRYAARAVVDGINLTRFLSEADYNSLDVPVEK